MFLLQTVPVSNVSFGLMDTVQFLLIAFAAGGLWAQVHQNGKRIHENRKSEKEAREALEQRHKERITSLELRHETLENRFLKAIEDLRASVSTLSADIRVLAEGKDK